MPCPCSYALDAIDFCWRTEPLRSTWSILRSTWSMNPMPPGRFGMSLEHEGAQGQKHGAFEFHVSMGCFLRWMPEDDAEALLVQSEVAFAELLAEFDRVELGPVECCDFETMHRFRPRGWIAPEGYRTASLQA